MCAASSVETNQAAPVSDALLAEFVDHIFKRLDKAMQTVEVI